MNSLFFRVDRAALTALTSVGRAILSKPSIQSVLNYLGLGEGSALPVGVPVPWPSATPPTGWLKCGAAFSSEKYPNLARVYPTLKLPDLRGEFIRGWDDSRGLMQGVHCFQMVELQHSYSFAGLLRCRSDY
nr:phage tail protein [Escherichia coli]